MARAGKRGGPNVIVIIRMTICKRDLGPVDLRAALSSDTAISTCASKLLTKDDEIAIDNTDCFSFKICPNYQLPLGIR